MRLENSFDVPAPPEQAWALLLDVPQVVPCMPGATLTETVDETHWKAELSVKLGPVGLTFLADIAREEADEAARRVKLSAKARDTRGRGNANATIESTLTAIAGGTRVDIVTDLQLSGPAAQFGRSVVPTVTAQLTDEFANCLKGKLGPAAPAEASAAAEPPAAASAPAPVKPIGGFSLLFRALLHRFFRR